MKKYIVKLLSYLCIISMILLTVIVLAQVVTRFFNISLTGTDELSRLLIVWLTFLGTSLAFHDKMHLAVNFFVKKAGHKNQQRIHTLVNGLIVVFFLVLTVYGFKFSIESMSYTSSTLQLPMGIFYLAVPVSSVFAMYFILTSLTESTTEEEEAGL